MSRLHGLVAPCEVIMLLICSGVTHGGVGETAGTDRCGGPAVGRHGNGSAVHLESSEAGPSNGGPGHPRGVVVTVDPGRRGGWTAPY